MRDFYSIVDELKHHLTKDKGKKVLDKDVAEILEISQVNFATLKRRNSTPYKHILQLCHKKNICCNELFFE